MQKGRWEIFAMPNQRIISSMHTLLRLFSIAIIQKTFLPCNIIKPCNLPSFCFQHIFKVKFHFLQIEISVQFHPTYLKLDIIIYSILQVQNCHNISTNLCSIFCITKALIVPKILKQSEYFVICLWCCSCKQVCCVLLMYHDYKNFIIN